MKLTEMNNDQIKSLKSSLESYLQVCVDTFKII